VKKRLVVLSAVALAVAGCISAGAVVTEPPGSSTTATPLPVASLSPVVTPVDGAPTLSLVSASHPGPEVLDVFAKCQIGTLIPVKQIAGMAKLPAVRDLTHYVPLTGREPQLKQTGPVWVIQIKGDVTQLSQEVWTDPICIVTDSDFGFFATGPFTDPTTGKTTQPEPPAVPPDRKLPPLAP
jgi:hypothetical protein